MRHKSVTVVNRNTKQVPYRITNGANGLESDPRIMDLIIIRFGDLFTPMIVGIQKL